MKNNKKKTLRNLGRCRRAYSEVNTVEDIKLLLENTMSELQDLLFFENVNWRAFDPHEPLEG